MSELTLTIIRLGLLVLLWIFVFSVVGVLRGDLYGTRVVSRTPRKPAPAARRGRRSWRRRGGHPPEARQAAASLEQLHAPWSSPTAPSPARACRCARRAPSIGRNPECALVLDDDFASGRHARIFHRDNAWFVEDLGSTNGTFVGTERLTGPVRVEAGSTLRIGKTVIELRR